MTIQELDGYFSKHILPSFKRLHNIPGAPFEIGDRVRVLDNPNQDETFDASFVNQIGSVAYFEYDCGCGQTYPFDPMIGVRFDGNRAEEFWKEEIRPSNEICDSDLSP